MVVVTTDDDEIAAVAGGCGARVVQRPDRLGAGHVPSREVILHAMDAVGCDSDVCLLHPTSPFRTGHDIDNAIQMLHGWDGSVVSFTNDEMNGAIYAARARDVRRGPSFMRLPIKPLHLPLPNGLDIDWPADLEWARNHVSRMEAALI